jgi:hypothetical protein
MKRKPAHREKWWVMLVRIPLLALGRILSPLYRISLARLDEHVAKRHQQTLASDVKARMGFLFSDHQARIVPNEGVPFPPSFDYAFVTVQVHNFFLRFSRGRDQLRVLLASASAPMQWHDLSLVLGAARDLSDLERTKFHDLKHVAASLRSHIQVLVSSCYEPRFSQLRQRLQVEVYAPESFVRRKWETDINTRLYGSE